MAKKKTQKKEQEIGIDFGRIKKKFTGKNAAHLKKYLPVVSIVAFILISMFFSIHFRSYSANLAKADDMAENSVKNMIKNNIQRQVRANYPNLPESELKKMINQQLSTVMQRNKINMGGQEVNIDRVIEQQANRFKEQLKHEQGNTYLLAIDPYYYYRHTKNYLEEGNEHGAEIDGKYYDPLVLAGTPEDKRNPREGAVSNLHVYFSAWTYKVMKTFNGNTTLMQAMFWVPVIISSLCVIPAFFLGRKMMGDFSGLISAMLIAVHPAVISRTAGGFADTDGYNVLFPLLSAWFLMEALDAKDTKNASIWGALTGLALGLFAFAWQGWYFMLLFLLITSVGFIAYKLIVHRHGKYNIRKALNNKRVQLASISTGVFVASTALFVTLFKSFSEFMKVFSIFSFTKIKVVGISKIWPNVYTTVAELNPAKLGQALSQASMGMDIFLFFALVGVSLPLVFFKSKKGSTSWSGWFFLIFTVGWGMLLLSLSKGMNNQVAFAVLLALPAAVYGLYNAYHKEDIPIHYTILLLVWLAGTIYSTGKGMRFIILMVPAFSIAGGIVIGKLIDPLTKLGELVDLRPIYLRVPAAVLIFLLLFMPFIPGNMGSSAKEQALNEIPQMNDQWYNTLQKIKKNSEPDAIINSWWDFGHWFAAIAERPVTLDGGRQNSPQAHWLGKLLLTSSQKESVGILRYLDCGANTGYDELLKLNNDSDLPRYETIQQIYSTLEADREEAKEILVEEGIKEQDAEEVLEYTHCNPPENYLITSGDMVGKSGVWSHFGSWDFRRATMYNKVHNNDKDEALRILQDEFDFSEDEAKNKYHEIMTAKADQWIAPWPGYAGTVNCNKNNNTIKCNNGLAFNLETEEMVSSQGQSRKPKEIAYIKDGDFRVKTYEENLMQLQDKNPAHESLLGVAFVPQGNNNYKAVMMDSRLTSSMFTRLFYFENQDGGLEHFEKFHKTTDVMGRKIIVWKVDWEGNQTQESAFEV